MSPCEDSTPICLHARLTLVPHSHPTHTGQRGRSPRGPAPRKALCLQPQPTVTLPGAHSVPSSGGPFLVLQKYGLSGWLHHSCLQASKVLNCAARGTRSPGWTGPPALASCPGEPTVTERGQGMGVRWGQTPPRRQEGPIQPEPHTSTSSAPPQVPVVSSHTSEKVPPTAHMPLLSPPRPLSLSCRGHSAAEQGPWFEAVERLGLLMVPELYACGGLGGSCQSSPDPTAPRQGQDSHLPLI